MQIRTKLDYCPEQCPYFDFTYSGGDPVTENGELEMTTPLAISCTHIRVCAVRVQNMERLMNEQREGGAEDAGEQADDGNAEGETR